MGRRQSKPFPFVDPETLVGPCERPPPLDLPEDLIDAMRDLSVREVLVVGAFAATLSAAPGGRSGIAKVRALVEELRRRRPVS